MQLLTARENNQHIHQQSRSLYRQPGCVVHAVTPAPLCVPGLLTALYTRGRVFIMKTTEAEIGKLPCGIFKMSDRILAGECFSSGRTEQWLFMLHKANRTLLVYEKGMLRVWSCDSLSGVYFSSLYPGPA